MSTPYAGAVDDGEGTSVDSKTGATYSYLAPWYVRGYTAHLGANGAFVYTPLIPSEPYGTQFAPFPADQNYAMIRQYYFSGDGDPLGGFLTFMPSDSLTITEGGVTWRMPARLSGSETWPAVDSGVSPWAFSMEGSGCIYIWRGYLAVRLLCTDSPNLTADSGSPLVYHVTEHFLGGRTFDITVPSADDGVVSDLTSLIVPGTVGVYAYDPLFPLGGSLGAGLDVPPTVPQPVSPVLTFLFPTATNTWTGTHHFPYSPDVLCTDPDGNVIEGNVAYTSSTTVTVTWSQAMTGQMELR